MVRVVDLVEAGPPHRRNERALLVVEGDPPDASAYAFFDRAQERYLAPDGLASEPHYFQPRARTAAPGGTRSGLTFGPEVTRRLRRGGVFTVSARDGEAADVLCRVSRLIDVSSGSGITIDTGYGPPHEPDVVDPPERPDPGNVDPPKPPDPGSADPPKPPDPGNADPPKPPGTETEAPGGPQSLWRRIRSAPRLRLIVGGLILASGLVAAALWSPDRRVAPTPDEPGPYPGRRSYTSTATHSEAWQRCEALMAPSWDPAGPGRSDAPSRAEAREAIGLCQTALSEASGSERGTILFRIGRAQQIGGERDTARQTLAAAFSNGSKAAAHALGNWHYNASPPQYAQAAENFRIGVRAGIARSKASLAGLLAEGQGVTQNISEAMRLAREAADAGVGAGSRVYGKLILDGKILGDQAEACRWFHQAIRQGDSREAVPLRNRAC